MDKCLRTNQGYAVKVSQDSSWVPQGREQDFHLQAFSGSQTDRKSHKDHVQLDDIKDNTDMILLQAGGDDASFAAVAYACIFVPEGQEWGPAYPDPKGRCYREIEKSQQYIFGKDENQLFEDTRALINTIFGHENFQSNPDFRLLISGYFEFFYAEEDAERDWCDSASFALRPNDRPKLSVALRKKINELVRGLNDAVKEAVAGSLHPDRTEFIDVNSQIEGHRFCQPGHTILDQYFGDKVYLWNMSPDGIVLDTVGSGYTGAGANDTYGFREPTLEEFQRWQETGLFTTDPREIPINMTDVANAGLGITPTPFTSGQPLDVFGFTLHGYAGMALRSFHPKDNGHSAMAQAIVTTLKNAPPKKPTPVVTDPKYKHSVQILFAHHGDDDLSGFSWYMFKGPFGIAVDPCHPAPLFKKVVADSPETRPEQKLEEPMYVGDGTEWYVQLEGTAVGECVYKAEQWTPGRIVCGDSINFPLTIDTGRNRPNVNCHVDSRNPREEFYHQAWVLEY
jgi:hypothetical protein